MEKISEYCEVTVIKVGREGSLIKRGDEIVKIGADKVKVRDTTGAGDLYASGFLYGYAGGMDPMVCGKLGALIAGKVIEITGARIEESVYKEIKVAVRRIIESDQSG